MTTIKLWKHLLMIFTFILVIACRTGVGGDYRVDALSVNEIVRNFVTAHNISGNDLEKIHKIIELMHDPHLFIRIDRRKIQGWLNSTSDYQAFRDGLEDKKSQLGALYAKRDEDVLSKAEDEKMRALRREIYHGEHDIRIFEEVIRRKPITAEDLPFVVTGAEAVEYGIRDGCTTATKTFLVLAKAAGIREVRFMTSGNVDDYLAACPKKGSDRIDKITVNGHFMALVKIQNRWALVNCTYFDPYSMDEAHRYEIFHQIDRDPITPDSLKLKIIRIPSFQRIADPPPPLRLYVIAIGDDSDDDLDVENWEALMNLSVSGNRDCPTCGYENFRPGPGRLH